MTKVLKAIHAFEQLNEIENEKDVLKKIDLLKDYGNRAPLNMILSLNFNYQVKLDLPEGMPPMDLNDMDGQSHPDMQGLLSAGIHRLKNCLVATPIKKMIKEKVFYEVITNCPLKDAEILCSAKDHALEELYPSIDAKLVARVFPTYVKAA